MEGGVYARSQRKEIIVQYCPITQIELPNIILGSMHRLPNLTVNVTCLEFSFS